MPRTLAVAWIISTREAFLHSILRPCFGTLALAIVTAVVAAPWALPWALAADAGVQLLSHPTGLQLTRSHTAQEELRAQGQRAGVAGLPNIHALVQLTSIPTEAQNQGLDAAGVVLQRYVPHNSWVAAIPAGRPVAALDAANALGFRAWLGRDKLHPRILAGDWAPWAVHPKLSNWVMVLVQLHADVELSRGAEILDAVAGCRPAADPRSVRHDRLVASAAPRRTR